MSDEYGVCPTCYTPGRLSEMELGGKQVAKEELEVIMNTVVELTKLRMENCGHLSIENFAPKLTENLIVAIYGGPIELEG